jgi:hypothetical protein
MGGLFHRAAFAPNISAFSFSISGVASPFIIAKGNGQKSANGSALDFEAQLGAAADKMRGHMNLAAGTPVSDPASFKDTFTNAPDRRSALRFTKWCPIQRNADSFRADLHPDLKADFILANPSVGNK